MVTLHEGSFKPLDGRAGRFPSQMGAWVVAFGTGCGIAVVFLEFHFNVTLNASYDQTSFHFLWA